MRSSPGPRSASGALGDAHGGRDVALGQAGPGRFDLDPVAQRGRGAGRRRDGLVDVGGGLVDLAEVARGRGARSSRRAGSSLGAGAEAGEQAEQGPWFDRLGRRLAEVAEACGGAVVQAGVEQERDRLERPVALDQLVGEAGWRRRDDGDGAEPGGEGEIELAGHLAAQRDAGGEAAVDEPGSAEAVEQLRARGRGSGRAGRATATSSASSSLLRADRGRPHHPRGHRDGVGARVRGWSRAAATMRMQPSAISTTRGGRVGSAAGMARRSARRARLLGRHGQRARRRGRCRRRVARRHGSRTGAGGRR